MELSQTQTSAQKLVSLIHDHRTFIARKNPAGPSKQLFKLANLILYTVSPFIQFSSRRRTVDPKCHKKVVRSAFRVWRNYVHNSHFFIFQKFQSYASGWCPIEIPQLGDCFHSPSINHKNLHHFQSVPPFNPHFLALRMLQSKHNDRHRA